MRSLIAGLFVAALTCSPALAHDYKLGSILIDHPWARASIGQVKNGAAYFTVSNHGGAADRLLSVASQVAARSELHTHLMEDGVMKMRPLTALEVTPGEPAVLQPGGTHVMLMGLTAPLVEGERFTLTLTFEKAGSIDVEVAVESATARGSGGESGHKHDHAPGS